jgi:hypothetical protein
MQLAAQPRPFLLGSADPFSREVFTSVSACACSTVASGAAARSITFGRLAGQLPGVVLR